MSKYQNLWELVRNSDRQTLLLTFDQAAEAAGVPIDHSFLTYKKELLPYGYRVKKISLKQQTILFERMDDRDSGV